MGIVREGVSILSGSSYRLYKLCKNYRDIKIIYTDIDSIYVLKESVDYEKFFNFCGDELGQLHNELGEPISKITIGGLKMDGYEYEDEVKLRSTKKRLTMVRLKI